MRVDITSEFTEVSMLHNGVMRSKMVNLSDLLDELSIYRSTNFGLLPKSVRINESSADTQVIGLEFEPRKRDLKYRSGGEEIVIKDCNVPGGMMFVKLQRGAGGVLQHVNSFIYAISGKRISFGDDRLYKMPFPNVYDDGRICWGMVRIGDITSLSATEGMVSSFFSNNFNSDLFYGGSLNHNYDGPRDNFVSYFKYIAANDFQPEWLEPTQFSVNQIASHLLKKG